MLLQSVSCNVLVKDKLKKKKKLSVSEMIIYNSVSANYIGLIAEREDLFLNAG